VTLLRVVLFVALALPVAAAVAIALLLTGRRVDYGDQFSN
jgi:hypothetical protein